jgi:hypothetical protein
VDSAREIKQVVIGERPRLIKIKNHPSKWRVDGQMHIATNGRVHPGLISLEHHQRRSLKVYRLFSPARSSRPGWRAPLFSHSLSLASFLFFSSAPSTQQATERERGYYYTQQSSLFQDTKHLTSLLCSSCVLIIRSTLYRCSERARARQYLLLCSSLQK